MGINIQFIHKIKKKLEEESKVVYINTKIIKNKAIYKALKQDGTLSKYLMGNAFIPWAQKKAGEKGGAQKKRVKKCPICTPLGAPFHVSTSFCLLIFSYPIQAEYRPPGSMRNTFFKRIFPVFCLPSFDHSLTDSPFHVSQDVSLIS